MGISVNNKLPVYLRSIGAQQAAATEEASDAIEKLLGYVATYPDDGIIFRKSDMVLATQDFLTNQNPGAEHEHIFLSKNDPKPKLNGHVLTIALIIKTVMASATEEEMAALCITAKNMIPLLNTLIEMGWPQPQTPIQTDNSTAVVFTNKTIVNKATKLANMKL